MKIITSDTAIFKISILWAVLFGLFTFITLKFMGEFGAIEAKILLGTAIIYGITRLSFSASNTINKQWGIMMFWLYSLFILFIPGLIQLSNAAYFWNDWGGYMSETELTSVFILCFGTLSVDIAYIIFMRLNSKVNNSPPLPHDLKPLNIAMVLLTILAVIWSALLIKKLGINFFMRPRGLVGSDLAETFSLATLGLMVTANSALLIALLLTYFKKIISKNTKTTLGIILLFLIIIGLNFIINYPPRMPRFMILGALLAMVFIFAHSTRDRLNIGYWISISFPFSLYFIFKFLGEYNRGEGSSIGAAMHNASNLNATLLHGDFDGMQLTIMGVRYVAEHGLTWGMQLLSAVFFFVPRSIWTAKSEASGKMLAENEVFEFTNLSSPIYIEAFIDFHAIGVLLVSIIFGWLISKSDKVLNAPNSHAIYSFNAIIFISFMPILLRGSLLAIIAFIASLILWSMIANITRLNIK